MGRFLEKMASIFGSGDNLPWTDEDIIKSCEQETASEGAGLTEANDHSESIMRLAWALVHSHNPSDVQRGIAMLEASFANMMGPLQRRETLYLLAVGQFRAGDYSRSRRLVDQALQMG
ncbi:hypothetical protein O6H91_21G000700 [Diphasiastrum complanatum]|uniref:Uncharacterized protein n=1 Tax=Diphasiastrum complanatum TaxID=34168 RepID=A0ACC2AH45_DIPCM|nr:hypothetical protein O6H91_21G000700 [Diphasiastrum complanatum]